MRRRKFERGYRRSRIGGRQPGAVLLQRYGKKKKTARRDVDKARNDKEEEVHNKLEEDGWWEEDDL